MKESKLTIQIASDLDFECLVAEVYEGERFLGLISQDKGIEKLEFVFPPGLSGNVISVPLGSFKEALELAELKLLGRR
jgi:hypothetical protein